MSELTIPGPELPAEAAARETILADLKAAFARREVIVRGYWGVHLNHQGYWQAREQGCCPIGRQIAGMRACFPGPVAGMGAWSPSPSVWHDAALLLGVEPPWVYGFVDGWDGSPYRPGLQERPYFWGFAAGQAAREIEPSPLEGGE